MKELLQEHINAHFKYNPFTGKIYRSDRRNSNGSHDKDGYLIYKIKGKQIKSHRLAWFLYYGFWPKDEIDHINRNRTDNRILNLRECSRSINHENIDRKPNIDTGEVGIYLDKYTKGLKAKFTTRIKGKTKRFRSIEDAKKWRQLNHESVSKTTRNTKTSAWPGKGQQDL